MRIPRAIALVESAQALQARFNTAFWCTDIETFALALDGDKQPCRGSHVERGSVPVHRHRTSRPRTARSSRAWVMSIPSPAGACVRLLKTSCATTRCRITTARVWPHDNSLIAAGAARYDDKAFALRILNGQFEAARHFDQQRLPELFCGFKRRGREAPLLFPVACNAAIPALRAQPS